MTIRAYNVQSRFVKESEQKVDYNQVCTYPSIIANRLVFLFFIVNFFLNRGCFE